VVLSGTWGALGLWVPPPWPPPAWRGAWTITPPHRRGDAIEITAVKRHRGARQRGDRRLLGVRGRAATLVGGVIGCRLASARCSWWRCCATSAPRTGAFASPVRRGVTQRSVLASGTGEVIVAGALMAAGMALIVGESRAAAGH
jgi:hypothetical protein